MNRLSRSSGLLGYALGTTLILPLLLTGYNFFFINKNNGRKYVKNYTRDYIVIPIDMSNSKIPENRNAKSIDFKKYTIGLFTKNMGRDGSLKTEMQSRVFYDIATKKYYRICMFDLDIYFWIGINNRKLYAKVNKSDYLNSSLGTKDQPLLVFSVKGADKPLSEADMGNEEINFDTTQDQYEYNVLMYLTYVVPKEEFKQRFENTPIIKKLKP